MSDADDLKFMLEIDNPIRTIAAAIHKKEFDLVARKLDARLWVAVILLDRARYLIRDFYGIKEHDRTVTMWDDQGDAIIERDFPQISVLVSQAIAAGREGL